MGTLAYFVTKSTHFAVTMAVYNKTVAFCNKQPVAFCSKFLLHFVITCHNEPNVKLQPLLIHKIKFLVSSAIFMLFPMSLVSSCLDVGCISVTPPE